MKYEAKHILQNIIELLTAIAFCEMAGVIGSFFTVSAISNWYATIPKPSFNPPDWIFGPVWTTLFLLMGISLFIVWKNYFLIRANKKILKIWKLGISVFIFQLVLNAFWSFIFFGLHNVGAAFAELIFLWIAILATIILFFKISKFAAWLLIPYIFWVTFAGFLNFSIWQLFAEPKIIFCSQIAKLCPDGSYVGRTGPNCEFAKCPGLN